MKLVVRTDFDILAAFDAHGRNVAANLALHLDRDPAYVNDSSLVRSVVDLEAVTTAHTTELVVAAARDTNSIHRAMDASVQIAGNGYQVQLPPAADASLRKGDAAPCQSAPGVLVISKDMETQTEINTARLATDLITIRTEQLN